MIPAKIFLEIEGGDLLEREPEFIFNLQRG